MKRPVEELADVVGTNGRQVPMIVYRLVVGGRATLDVATTTVNDRFRTVLAVFLVAFVTTFYALRLWAWDRIQADLLARDAAIVAARPLEVVVIQARIGAGVGVVIAAIAVTYLARDAFVDRDPRTVSLSGRALAGLGGVAICSFVAGVAAAYLGLVPFLLDLVATNVIEAGFAPTYSIATWTSFVLVYSTWIGLGALLPLVMGITTAVGVVSNGAFRRRWPVAGIVCLSSVLNWSIDPFTVFFAAVPVVLCYGVGVGAATVGSTWRGRRRPDADRTIARRDADPGTTAVDRVTVTAERDVARGDRDTGAHYESPEALFVGVAFSPDGSRLYASAGANNKVRVYDVGDGELSERDPIRLEPSSVNEEGDEDPQLFAAGLTITDDGERPFVANNLDNSVLVIDLDAEEVIETVGIGNQPYTVALTPDETKAYVSNWGDGTVSVIDTESYAMTESVLVGMGLNAIVADPERPRMYVADGNSDTVSVIDTESDEATDWINLEPYEGAPFGSLPNTLTISDDGETLYVANMKGVGSGPNPNGPNPAVEDQPNVQYIGNLIPESLSVVDVPNEYQLTEYTEQVVENNGFDETSNTLFREPEATEPKPIPDRLGDPSPIEHVIYVTKENRTYD
jgi:YVTN family beta-propeller protein